MPAPPERRRAYIAWVIVCLVWGTTYLGIRVALETFPPALLGGIRYTIAGLVLAAILVARGRVLPPRAQWRTPLVLGFLMIVVGNGLVVWAEQWVPSGVAAVVIASAPFWMAGIEAVLPGGERFTGRTAMGLCIGFAGIVLLLWPQLNLGGAMGRQFVLGAVALQIACAGWSLGSSYSKRHSQHDDPLVAAALQMFFGGLMMLVIGTVRGEWALLTFSTRSVIAELYLIVFGAIAGFSAYVYALKYLPVTTVSLYAYVNPIIAVLLGSVLLGEPFGWRVVSASMLVLAGVAVVRMTQASSSPSRDAESAV